MSMPLALRAYLALSRMAGVAAPALLRRREARGKEDPHRLGERLGQPGQARPDGPLIWLHGASVGEAMSMLPLIAALQARGAGEILVTTGTVTSAHRIAPLLPPGARHQYVPVDTAQAVARFLDHWQPDLGIWVESELWPRLVVETHARQIPMAMVNARLSARSHRRWQRSPAMARALFSRFGAILAQDHETVSRLAEFGASPRFAGNLKALVDLPAADGAELERLRGLVSGRPIWLAASTHAGEEAGLLAAQRALRQDTDCLMILAPRHPERADEIAALPEAAALTVARRSTADALTAETDVLLADTLGEMALWYAVAPVTLVGGSWVPKGGHTPFEPIAGGSAVVHGPHVDNFAPAYGALDAASGAIAVPTLGEVSGVLRDLLADPEAAGRITVQARQTHAELRPDPDAMADAVLGLMGRSGNGQVGLIGRST